MISILIPVHGQVALLRQCLQSIIRYTNTFEVWVYDNGSDEWAEIRALCRELGAHYIRNEHNLGFIKPCNELASRARGEYLCLMNSDVVINGPWEQQATQALDDVVRLVGMDARLIYQSGYTSALNQYSYNYLEASFWLMHRNTYEQFGLFDEEHLHFAYCEDVEYCLRLQEVGLQIQRLDLPVTHLRNRTRNKLPPETRAYLKQCWQDNKAWVLNRYRRILPAI